MKTYEIKLTFTEPLLGTVPKDPEVYKTHVMNRAAVDDAQAAEELDTVEKVEEKGWTGFHRMNGTPILYDYVIKGFFKDACSMLRRAGDTKSAKLAAFKKVIDGLIFAQPRMIELLVPEGKEIFTLERPLRASTPQGERVALARSDACPVGTTIIFKVLVLGSVTKAQLEEWLDYGKLRGLGQWRNAGYGAFEYALAKA